MEDNIQSVYNKLVSYGYEGTEDDFRNYISDDANIPSVYDKFVSKGYQGTEDDFRGFIGMPSQAKQPAQRVDVSDVEKAEQPFVPTMEPEDMQTPSAPVGQMQQVGQPANVGDDTMMRMHRAGKPDWSGYQQQQYEKAAGEVNAKYGIPTKLSTENYDVVSQRLANLDKEYDRIAERQSIFVDDDIEPSWVARDNARLASLNEERDALRAYKTAFGTTDERQSYEQRVGSVFDEIDKEGVAERAWDNAEKRTAEAQSGEPYNVAGIFNMGVEKLKYHDLQRMADEAWNMLGAEKQQEITDKLYEVLKDYYPDADEQSLREGAEKMARQQSNQRVFDVAVENNAPKNALDHFFRKAVGMNFVYNVVEGLERNAAGTTGDWEAREVAEQEFDNGWHKVVGIGGTVTGFLFDPIAKVSGGAGGALAKGGVSLLERFLGAATTRKFTTSLVGRTMTGALAGAGNLGTFEAANEAVNQFRWGGTRLQDPETGRYIIGDYSGGQVLKSLGHGALMGSTTGIIAPMIGNVSDKLVNATGSTAGKTALRTGEIALGTVAEGTVFSIPEFVDTYIEYGDAIAALSDENSPAYIADEAERSKAIEELVSKRKGAMMDVWTDNMAMMAGFKAQHILKSAPQRIAELRSSGRGKAGFETRLRDMLDGKEGLGLTEDEKRELNRSGYGDLNNLVDEYQDYVKSRKNQTVRPDRLLQDGGGELGDIPYNRFEQLMGDQSVSESARAKMYYYITGNVLPMSTVTGSTFTEVKDPSGNVVGYQVQSMGNNGIITSKTFRNEKAARVEENKILRQVELNAIDGGERWFDNTSEMRGGEQKTSKDVRSDLFNKYYVDIDKAVEKEPTRRSKVEQQAVDEYIKTLWGDVIQEQKAEERQHQETKAEMLKLKAASEGLADDLAEENDPVTLKNAGRDMRDARRALSDKIGEERMQALENMDEDQLATAYSEADADTQTLMKKWLISSDQDAVAEGLSQRSVSAVGQFKESIVSFFENNAASGDAQRSKLDNGMLTLVDVDGSPYIVVGTHGRMYTVKDVNGNARMVDASQCKNERDVSLDQFVLEQTAPELDRYAALAEAFNGTDYTPGQVAVVGEGGRGKQVMVLGVDGENVTYADGYTVGKNGQVQVVAERTVPKQQFRDMVEQWEKKAEQDAKRQASLTNVPVSQMEAGMRFPVEWRGEIMTAEVVEDGGKKSVNIVGQDGSVVERGIDDFTDEDWQAIRVVVPEQEKDVVDQSQKSNIGVGDVVSYNGEVGGALSGTVVDVKDNGLVTFETPDGDRYTKWRSLLKVEKPAVDETPADVKPEQENKPVEIPRTESGDIAHSLLDVNDKETYDAAVREEVENALAFAKDGDAAYVENNLVAAQAAVEEAEKKVPTAQGAAQRRAELETIGNERAAARNLVDFWKEVSKEKSKKVWEDLQNPKEVSNFAADPEKQQEWVDSHYDDIINGYVATYGNKLDPDELRKALKPIGYDGSNVEEFRDQEIRLRDDLYGRMLKAAVDSGNPSITILTGVGGAGKSTATQNMDLSGRGLVFDAALNKPKKLAAAIKKAKDAGMKDIQVVAVKNDAPTAFENTLRRGLSEGRFLPLEYFTKSYQDNQGKIAEIRDRYPDVEIVSYDNSGNNGRGVTIDEASNWDYTIDDETLSKLLDIYENGIDQGRFTADQAAAIGRGLSEITWSRGSRAAELDRRISRIERRIRQAGDGLLRSEVSAQRSGSGRRDLGSSSMGDEGDGGSNPRPAGQGSGAEGTGYVARFDQLDRDAAAARLSGDTESLSRINSDKAKTVQEYLDSIKTDDAYVLTADNYESVLKANEVKEEDIQQVRDMYEYTRREHKRMGGFNIDGKIYVFADDVRSIDDARSTYVHERQHNINDKDVNLLPEVEAAAGRDELLSYVQALSGTHAYDNMTHKRLADEFLSMAMEVAYRTDDVETALREMGIENDELINIIKRLDDEQRTSDSLANARRNTYVDNNGQGSGRPDGTDQGRRPAEVGGQGLRPDEGGRQETEGVRVSDEGVTSISDAAEKEGSGIEVGGDTRFNIATEPQLQRQIKDYVKTRDAQNAGWTDEKVSAVVAETEDLIKAIDNALSGEKFYKEWSGRMPTVKVDWRDGEEKPTVTWTRGNIDYKYDMSADLLCINNEGMEDVLSSPTMVDLMLAMQKGKKGFTSDDYMTLYNTLDDLGFVVPCKGCFDAAARFKMLPSTSQKFVDLVNETIDRRNKDKEAFDNMLRARAAKSGSALPNGLPSSAKNKEEAVEIGVAGDDLTEHITWTQLMSAEGQTKALYDWGGVFRAWQRTGAGRPKDKLLPEPYSGDIMSPFATIVAPYGEKTPSFREYEVNVGTGLRRNSHSEFRPILAVDEIQFMRDAYLRNLMVFKYMKELDDVRLFGKMGVKFNMSFFPAFVDGTPAAGLDKDGNYIASEESVGSREFEYMGEDGRKHYDGMKGFQEAQKYVNDNVSLSSVVFSVPHLIKAFTDVPTPTDKSGVWGSLIPFHNSGAVKSQIKKQGLGDERAESPKDKFEVEAMTDYDKGVTNFEQVQNDRFGEGWVIVEGKKKGTAVEPGHKLEFANGTHYYNERLGLHLFGSFYIYDNEIPSDMDLTDGNYSKADLKKLGHEYSIDYNDKVRELNSDYGYKEAVDEYVDFMRSIGLVPRFDFTVPEATFLEMCERAKVDPRHPKLGWKGEGNGWSPADAESYYSLWCDYGMTDPATGKWSPHRPVGYIDENGERSFRMPDNTVDIVREGVARYSERKRAEEGRVNEAITEFTRRSVDAGKLSEEAADEILERGGVRFNVTGEDVTTEGEKEESYFNDDVRFKIVDDEKLLDELNNGKTVKVYRAMQMQDGKLYPPMAGRVDGKWQMPSEVGVWMQADERPDLVDKDGKFKLDKGNGKDIKAKYNPYWHTSRSPLNDQFSSAWSRPELVTVEVEVPESELTSGYKAAKAKDAVGEMDWHSGPVSGKLAKRGNPRKVILSRYNRLVRVVPDEEVADRIAEMLEGTGISIPFNTVTPSLREALEERGVKIGKPQKGNAGDASMDAYEEWKDGGTRFRVTPEEDKAYMTAVQSGDMETAQRMVNEAAKAAGYTGSSDFRMSHTAPSGRDGFSKSIANPEGIYPDDLYSPQGALYYGDGEEMMDRASAAVFRRIHGNPDAMVKIYRAVPKSLKESKLRNGDWVTINRQYAVEHGERNLDNYKIIEDDVPAKFVYTDGNSLHEQGYDDGQEYAYQDTKNNRKLIDAVTYDDDGNVIPLSKRFNKRNPDPRFSIIGEKGSANDETAMANLEIAKQMEKEGKDAKTMWLATGWEKGTDGKWRREIPDLKPKDIDPKTAKTVGELVDAPELFEAYPQLKDIKVSFKKLKGMGGKYTDSDNSITLNPDYTTDFIVPEEFDDIARQKMRDWYMSVGIPTIRDINSQHRKIKKSLGRRTMTELGKEILEHELQHAIQHIEGFATGGTSTAMSKDYVDNEYNGAPGLLTFAKYWSSGNSAPRLMAYGKQRMAEAIRKNINAISAEERQAALDTADMFEVMSDADYNAFVRDARDLWSKIKKEGKEGYRNLAGEVEARNAQKRGVMTEEERRSTPPSETEDTPRNKQIVRGVGEGVGFGSEGSEIDETAIDEKYDAGMLSRREMLAETLLDMAQRNKDDNQAKMDAIRAVARALNETMKTSDNPNFDIAMQDRSVASAQRTYDKATVNGIVRLARLMSKSDLFKDFSRVEVNRLLTLVKNAAGRKDISQQANKVADMMLQHAVKEMDGILKKQLNVKGAKTNAQGVMEQGRLDLQGQRMVDAMKRGMELDDASLQELIDEANDGMGSDNESKAANAAVDYQGYMLAKQYIDDIKASKAEEDRMRDDIRKKEQEVKDGELDRKAYNEFVNETERAIRENKVQRVNAYGRLLTSVGQDIKDSFGRAKAFRDAQIEHVNDIHHNANSDLEGMPSSEHSTADNKLINSSAARFLLRPVADFDEMLRFLGRKSVDGKGYLFNRFMPAFTKASDTEHKNKYADHQELDAKVSDVFGRKMRWSDLFAVEGSLPTINVRFRDGGEMKDHELTQGKALYVYMVNKMTDGRMKLRAMGITDDDVQAIKDQLDPRFVELADWVQGEFLPKLRERYNEVHTRMFGAPMDAIEDYFRLEINDRSRGREMDISAPENDMKPSTVTGSIKKRVKNSTALDLTNTDAFDMLLGNIDEMEHWAAFAEFNRDINILLSYNKFRNRVMNMTSARFGSGETLWNNLVDTARIVAGVYQPKVRAKDLDNALVNMSKGVTAAKISFRLYTALKQLLSYPAYLSEASPVELVKSSNPVGAVKAWNWAMENLPGFAKRWQSRQAGDTRLKETDVDWQLWKNKIIETAGRLGMTPNAFVDAMTVAMGSKAVYETALKRYMNDGYSKEAAEEKAKMDASLAYNETQQSSENAYVSGMQLDRTLAATALTVFRNASMAYERRFMRALSNMKKMSRKGFREENMEFAKKQMMRDGLTEEQAEEAAKRSYRRAWAKNAADIAIFGWVLQFAWNLGSDLMYLLFGKDDDLKEEMLKDAALHAVAGGVEGLSGGSIMSEYYNTMRKRKEYEEKYGKAPSGQKSELNLTTLPIMSDIKTTMQHFDQDDVRGINDIVNLVIQAGVGVNPQTITDAVVAIVDAANGDMETGKEIGMLLMRLAQVPQSQVDNIYIDELGMTAKDAKNLDVDAMAKRYARYKNRRDTFFTGWMYDEGEREKAEERYAKRFDKKIQERIQAMDDDEVTDALENANPEMKEKFNKEYANRQGITYTKSSTEYGKVYDKLVTPKDISEDAVLKQAKKDAKETGDDRLYKEIDSFQRQLTNIKKGASYHIGDVKVSDEDSPGLGKSEKSDESVMRNIRKQRERFLKRHGLISGEEE